MRIKIITEFSNHLTMLFLMMISIMHLGCAAVYPTVIVIDDETNKPIEGAVAIAIWRGATKDCTLVQGLEGGCEGPVRIDEVVSDKDGNINIKDFWKPCLLKDDWNWWLCGEDCPRITVYKFGYVCWDRYDVFAPNYKWQKRTDFDKKHRIVRMGKWPNNFPLNEHSSFMSYCTNGNYSPTKNNLFIKEFMKQDQMSK
jgi:hypothetical protein